MSALKVTMVGALVAFGGYSAIAGTSMLLSRMGDGAASVASAKAEMDCMSSRFAWRPECQGEKVEAASSENDKARRTRQRSAAGATVEPSTAPASAPVALPEPTVTASVTEPVADAVPPGTRAVERRAVKRPEASPSEPAQSLAAPDTLKDSKKSVATAPNRERRAESLRFKAEPDADEAGTAKAAASESDRRAARARLVAPARRDAAQFASLPRERPERDRRPRSAEASEPAAAGDPRFADEGWRERRNLRLARRQDRGPERMALPPGMTVTSVRTVQLPDGRLVDVHVRPRPEVVRALVAQHRANMARTASAFPWGMDPGR